MVLTGPTINEIPQGLTRQQRRASQRCRVAMRSRSASRAYAGRARVQTRRAERVLGRSEPISCFRAAILVTFRSVPFFEPLPPEPEPPEEPPSGWRPPIWDRPSEALLGVPVPMSALLAKTQRVALALTHVEAYPNGFTFELVIMSNPMGPRAGLHAGPFGMGGPRARRGPRIGFEFADGKRVGDGIAPPGVPMRAGAQTTVFGPPKDAEGIPTEPVLRHHGGGGNGQHFAMRFWCFPLPPPGPLKVFTEWMGADIPETVTVLEAAPILDASSRVVTIWDADSR